MSRLSDLQGVLRGLGKIGSCSCQTNVRDFKNLYENTYIKPVVQQAVKIVLNIKDPVQEARNKSQLKTESVRERNKGLSLQKTVDNIPLVLEGMGRAVHTNYYAKFNCECLKVTIYDLVRNVDNLISKLSSFFPIILIHSYQLIKT